MDQSIYDQVSRGVLGAFEFLTVLKEVVKSKDAKDFPEPCHLVWLSVLYFLSLWGLDGYVDGHPVRLFQLAVMAGVIDRIPTPEEAENLHEYFRKHFGNSKHTLMMISAEVLFDFTCGTVSAQQGSEELSL